MWGSHCSYRLFCYELFNLAYQLLGWFYKGKQFILCNIKEAIIITFLSQLFHSVEKSTKSVFNDSGLDKMQPKLGKHTFFFLRRSVPYYSAIASCSTL